MVTPTKSTRPGVGKWLPQREAWRGPDGCHQWALNRECYGAFHVQHGDFFQPVEGGFPLLPSTDVVTHTCETMSKDGRDCWSRGLPQRRRVWDTFPVKVRLHVKSQVQILDLIRRGILWYFP